MRFVVQKSELGGKAEENAGAAAEGTAAIQQRRQSPPSTRRLQTTVRMTMGVNCWGHRARQGQTGPPGTCQVGRLVSRPGGPPRLILKEGVEQRRGAQGP